MLQLVKKIWYACFAWLFPLQPLPADVQLSHPTYYSDFEPAKRIARIELASADHAKCCILVKFCTDTHSDLVFTFDGSFAGRFDYFVSWQNRAFVIFYAMEPLARERWHDATYLNRVMEGNPKLREFASNYQHNVLCATNETELIHALYKIRKACDM